jgi:hypothetical protein
MAKENLEMIFVVLESRVLGLTTDLETGEGEERVKVGDR